MSNRLLLVLLTCYHQKERRIVLEAECGGRRVLGYCSVKLDGLSGATPIVRQLQTDRQPSNSQTN